MASQGREPTDQTVDVGESGARARFALPAGTEVRGRVQLPDGTPLPHRQISFYGLGRRRLRTWSDDGGTFSLPSVPPGDYDVHWEGARGEFGKNGPVRVSVPSGPLTLVVSQCTLRGLIGPLAGSSYRVDLEWDGWPRLLPVEVDERGSFRVDGISAGTWILRWHVSGTSARGSKSVLVEGDTFVTLDARR